MNEIIQFMEIARKSKAKQSDVDTLVRQIKTGCWIKRKPALIK